MSEEVMMMRQTARRVRQKIGVLLMVVALLIAGAILSTQTVLAQGMLTVTPGRTISTVAGSGNAGYTGDGGQAAAASVASPHAIAYDSLGNLFFADTANHVVREITTTNVIVTVAGTGVEGYSGDGAAATSAQLDTPNGIALDSAGNLYIADTHNQRIRKVSGGVITTIAGSGTPGFSGDGAAATSATLSLPSSVTVDANGTVYIADTNNHRIRRVAGGTITTIAGNGVEFFAGDGAAAISASLDSPTGVAVDATGHIYIADRHNQRVRMIDAFGIISTIAGTGTPGFAGSFSGDGVAASTTTLAKPTTISFDQAGNLYIADTGNQRIRQVSGGTITTLAGTGEQGSSGDGGPASAALLNSPRAITTDVSGNLLIADTLNQRLRSATLSTLTFALQTVGVLSTPQAITIASNGVGPITVSAVAFTGVFAAAAGGTCHALPITLAAGSSCTQNITYLPIAIGPATGSVNVSGASINPQTVLLSGAGAISATNTTLTSNYLSAFITESVTFTATVMPTGLGTATGSVTFYDGVSTLGTAQPLTNNAAALSIATLALGTHNITAVYSGDTNFGTSTSGVVSQLIGDFNFTIVPNPADPAGSTSQTIIPGQAATFNMMMQAVSGPFSFPVSLSARGLPPGATVVFSPQTLTVGSTATAFTMKVQTAQTTAGLGSTKFLGGSTLALALLLLPFSSSVRRRARRLRPLAMVALLLGSTAMLTGLTGCGTGTGFFGQSQKSYTIEIVGTAAGTTGATLQHVASVQLTVQ